MVQYQDQGCWATDGLGRLGARVHAKTEWIRRGNGANYILNQGSRIVFPDPKLSSPIKLTPVFDLISLPSIETTMTIVLTPYWSNGVQKLKLAPQRMPQLFSPRKWLPIHRTAPKPKHGLVPPALDESVHALRCLTQLRSKDKNIEKYIYLSALKDQDPNMFYKLCLQNMSEFTPIIYTPTVGDACLQYSHIYRRPEGLVRTFF